MMVPEAGQEGGREGVLGTSCLLSSTPPVGVGDSAVDRPQRGFLTRVGPRADMVGGLPR